jgi:hypothetical protein
METPTKRTERSVRGIERSNQIWTTAELEAAVAEDRAFWKSPAGVEARAQKLLAAKSPKPVFRKSLLAARARQFKA